LLRKGVLLALDLPTSSSKQAHRGVQFPELASDLDTRKKRDKVME
jgi:hypothetical protein